MSERPTGVAFPIDGNGRRSTTPVARAIVDDGLSALDPSAGPAASVEPWRHGYLGHFRRLTELSAGSPEAFLAAARAGLGATYERLTYSAEADREMPLAAAVQLDAGPAFTTSEIRGEGAAEEFALPYRGESLRGDAVRRCLGDWVERGIVEPGVADAVDAVIDHPEWLSLTGWVVVVLGAGAQMGPVSPLLRWGATVAAVDLPSPRIWEPLVEAARAGAGRLLMPVRDPALADPGQPGADILTDALALGHWVAGLPGRPVVGTYLYGDGGLHVRLSAAADLLTGRALQRRGDTALAFLATPTDAYAVPAEAVEHARAGYRRRSLPARAIGSMSAGRLLQPPYRDGEEPSVCDSLVAAQGPNYALAKRIQRWRAAAARADGQLVSFHVAPSTRTASVLRNRSLAAAFAGARHFGVEIFEPATANTLMSALLVHDLNQAPPSSPPDWRAEAAAAAHGGLWRTPYAPRSALPLAAALGAPATLRRS